MHNPRILSVATATPPHLLEQKLVRRLAGILFSRHFKDVERLLPVFENSGIERRYISRPVDWFGTERSFPEVNRVHEEVAAEVAGRAASKALERAGLSPAEVGAIIVVCSTGFCTPSLDSKLILKLGMDAHCARLPAFGLGCAGGVSGLARAAELSGVGGGRKVLLVAVELCSLTFLRGDLSKSNLVATALFGDGAAAVVVGPGGQGPELLASQSHLFADSEDLMGWDVVEAGLKVRFSRSIPAVVHNHMAELVEEACRGWGIARSELMHFVAHPGGAKVLSAYQQSLRLAGPELEEARSVLRDFGNMSSPSVLFVLERFLARRPQQGALGLMMALGPGFSSEQVLFRW